MLCHYVINPSSIICKMSLICLSNITPKYKTLVAGKGKVAKDGLSKQNIKIFTVALSAL